MWRITGGLILVAAIIGAIAWSTPTAAAEPEPAVRLEAAPRSRGSPLPSPCFDVTAKDFLDAVTPLRDGSAVLAQWPVDEGALRVHADL